MKNRMKYPKIAVLRDVPIWKAQIEKKKWIAKGEITKIKRTKSGIVPGQQSDRLIPLFTVFVYDNHKNNK